MTVIIGDAKTELAKLKDKSVNCCVTSPPYFGLRDYGVDGQLGLEETPGKYVENLVEVFREVSRVLKDDGTLWLVIGDSYAGYHGNKNAKYEDAPSNKNGYFENQRKSIVGHGLKNKDLIGIPWKVAFALQEDGWYLRCDIIWNKPSCMPESVKDRPTKTHEYIFLFSKSPCYYYDHEAIKEPAKPDDSVRDRDKTKLNNTPGRRKMGGLKVNNYKMRNKRSVWTVSTKPYKGAHFATFPPDLIKPCILAGCPENGIVLDCFGGSGTVGQVAKETGRDFILIELNPEYKPLIDSRINKAHYQRSF